MSNFKDFPGQKFGRLVVVRRVENDKWGGSRWLCQCDCGKEKIVGKSKLTGRKTKSCGCWLVECGKNKVRNLVGKRFGRLVVRERAGSDKNNHAIWLCDCDCGNTSLVLGTNLEKEKHTRSCGCYKIDRAGTYNLTHEMSGTPIYNVWGGMIARCSDLTDKNYGGRGIRVCEEWKDASTFLKWADGKYKEGLAIDRRDNEGNYSPDNCRFVHTYINAANRRKLKSNTSGYTGITRDNSTNRYRSRINSKPLSNKRIMLGWFKNKEEAVQARNDFIIKHNLPHPVQEINENLT